jgi:hypothetical protein
VESGHRAWSKWSNVEWRSITSKYVNNHSNHL